MQKLGEQAAFVSAGGYHHHIGLNTWNSEGGLPPAAGTTGLYHVAILYPTRGGLADALRRLERPAFSWTARATTASAKRCIYTIQTATVSNFIGTARTRIGRGGLTASWPCIRSLLTSLN